MRRTVSQPELPENPVHEKFIPAWLERVEWRDMGDVERWKSHGANASLIITQLQLEHDRGGPLAFPSDPYAEPIEQPATNMPALSVSESEQSDEFPDLFAR